MQRRVALAETLALQQVADQVGHLLQVAQQCVAPLARLALFGQQLDVAAARA